MNEDHTLTFAPFFKALILPKAVHSEPCFNENYLEVS